MTEYKVTENLRTFLKKNWKNVSLNITSSNSIFHFILVTFFYLVSNLFDSFKYLLFTYIYSIFMACMHQHTAHR